MDNRVGSSDGNLTSRLSGLKESAANILFADTTVQPEGSHQVWAVLENNSLTLLHYFQLCPFIKVTEWTQCAP